MSDDKERRDQALVPQSTRELTTRSTLARRGLNDHRNSQSRLDSSDAGKVPRLKAGTKVYTTDGIPGEIIKSRASDEGPVYTLSGSLKVEGRDWNQDELTKFDEARYAQGKALFQSAMKHFASEGKTPIEQMAGLVNALRTTFAIPDATIKAMKPDVLRFIGELVDEQAKQAGNKPSELPQGTSSEAGQPEPWPAGVESPETLETVSPEEDPEWEEIRQGAREILRQLAKPEGGKAAMSAELDRQQKERTEKPAYLREGATPEEDLRNRREYEEATRPDKQTPQSDDH